MAYSAKRRTLLGIIGIGGLSIFILLAGALIYFDTIWRYRLVLRDEPLILGVPAPFCYLGVVCSLLILWIVRVVAAAQNRRIGWGIKVGRDRGGALQWEDVILCVIFGAMLGTIGTALFINSHFDKSPEQSHLSKVTQMYTRTGSRGARSYYICLTDWKNPQAQINLAFDREIFDSHQVGELVTIKTKRGFLGYEWITGFK
jgi:hypothetical protein